MVDIGAGTEIYVILSVERRGTSLLDSVGALQSYSLAVPEPEPSIKKAPPKGGDTLSEGQQDKKDNYECPGDT